MTGASRPRVRAPEILLMGCVAALVSVAAAIFANRWLSGAFAVISLCYLAASLLVSDWRPYPDGDDDRGDNPRGPDGSPQGDDRGHGD